MTTLIDDRYITVGAAGTLPAVQKEASDAFFYTFDFANWLDTDTISSATASGDVGITVGTPTYTATTVKVKVSGGTSGTTYVVTVTGTTTGTQTKVTKISVYIK